MKTFSSLIGLVLLSFSTAVFAQQGGSCLAGSENLDQNARVQFITNCLARISQASNVKEEDLKLRKASCAQNAKNMKLEGDGKRQYVNACINSNEAADLYATIQR